MSSFSKYVYSCSSEVGLRGAHADFNEQMTITEASGAGWQRDADSTMHDEFRLFSIKLCEFAK